jgi:hypothetical protein
LYEPDAILTADHWKEREEGSIALLITMSTKGPGARRSRLFSKGGRVDVDVDVEVLEGAGGKEICATPIFVTDKLISLVGPE